MRPSILGALAGVMLSVGLAWSADPVEFRVGAFDFSRPEGWQWIVPSSPMRKAQLNIAVEGADPVEVTFFHFGPGQGGSVQANVDRWVGQFQNARSEQNVETFGKTQVTFVRSTGTFLSGMPGQPSTPKDGYALRGAILENKDGDVYVKMTGPGEAVLAASDAFRTMVAEAAGR